MAKNVLIGKRLVCSFYRKVKEKKKKEKEKENETWFGGNRNNKEKGK